MEPTSSPQAWHGTSFPTRRSANLPCMEVADTGPEMYRSSLSNRQLFAGCTQIRGSSDLPSSSKHEFSALSPKVQAKPKRLSAKTFPKDANGLAVALACGAGAWRVALGALRQGFPLDHIPHFHRGQNRDWPRLWQCAPTLNLAPESQSFLRISRLRYKSKGGHRSWEGRLFLFTRATPGP